MTKPGDVDYFVRVRTYEAILHRYASHSTELSLLPLAMRMGGPREAVWHAIIRKNYGCSHFIVGRDHAGPGADRSGKPFYGPYDAQELIREHRDELGIEVVEFQEMVYVEDIDQYQPQSEVKPGSSVLLLSGTDLRQRLADGAEAPEWFSYPEVMSVLRQAYPPRSQQGFTVFFTGLPSSGKSTLANVLMVKLMEVSARPVTLLDGDLVRKNLSSELGFSKEHRDLNISGSATSPARSRSTGAWPSARQSLPTPQCGAKSARWSAPTGASSKSTSLRPSRYAKRGTAKDSTPRRAQASSPDSPASTTRTKRPSTPRSSWTRPISSPSKAWSSCSITCGRPATSGRIPTPRKPLDNSLMLSAGPLLNPPPQSRGRRSNSNPPPQSRGRRSKSNPPRRAGGRSSKSNPPPQSQGRRSKSNPPRRAGGGGVRVGGLRDYAASTELFGDSLAARRPRASRGGNRRARRQVH